MTTFQPDLTSNRSMYTRMSESQHNTHSGHDDPTMPPRYVIEHYRKAYNDIHKRDPLVRYMGNHWYYVNGETVHRKTLLEEVARLCEQAEREAALLSPSKSLIHRLINKLRNI